MFPLPIPRDSFTLSNAFSLSQVEVLPSPALISLDNELTMAVITGDALYDIQRNCVNFNSKKIGHKQAGEALVNSLNLYPVNPGIHALDLTKLGDMALEEQADIYVVPSRLMDMCETIQDSLLINPKRASFDSNPGKYAVIEIEQLPPGTKTDIKSNVKARIFNMA